MLPSRILHKKGHTNKVSYSLFTLGMAFLFIIISPICSAQLPDNLRHIALSNGLSNNTIRTIFQDSRGYMWFGTDDGLNRYDAYQFTKFRNIIKDTTSLPHNYIFGINEDQDGNVIIGTGQGLVSYNEATGLKHIRYRDKNGLHTINSNIFSVLRGKNKMMVIGARNDEGLIIKNNDNVEHISLYDGENEIERYYLQATAIDNKGDVWAIIEKYGLCKYDPKSKLIRIVNTWTPSGQANKMITDEENNLWIGTTDGLYKYSLSQNEPDGKWGKGKNELSESYISDLALENGKKLWIGTLGGGINLMDIRTEKIQYFNPSNFQNSLSSQNITSIYIDREGRKWIGTLRSGINIIDDNTNHFKSVSAQTMGANTLTNNMITGIGENKEYLWLGTDGEGITIWNRKTNHFSNIRNLENNNISSISKDHEENLWISTFGGGLYKYSNSSKSLKHYRCFNAQTRKENKIVLRVYEDKNDNIWATTYEDGRLYKLNNKTDQFEVFIQDELEVFSIVEDDRGNLWGGSFENLMKIDRVNKTIQNFSIGKTVRALYNDNKGNLWVGTEGGGLLKFDLDSNKFVNRYSEEDGLSNNSVLNIMEDDRHILWLATFNGLSRFDPQTEKFINFYESDGLLSNQFNYRAALKLNDGEIAFGSINGLNIFDPKKITPRTFMPPLNITDIFINNKPISVSKNVSLKSDLGKLKSISIPYREAFLTFNFAALDYSTPDKIKYAYLMEGWDKSWNYTQARSVTYNSIYEGHYTLRIKSTNSSGEWNPQETILKVIVLPPWYRTWWAITIYSLILGAMVFYFIRYQNNKNKLKYEVQLAHQNATNERELSERKASFFTNISHEFRNLLTLIINPIEDVIESENIEEKQDGLEAVYRNSKRMLGLVDQLLIYRKADKGEAPMQVSKYNFFNICQEVFESFSYRAKSKEIDYTIDTTNKDLEVYVDIDKIEIAIFNLISNALKFTPNQGFVKLDITEDQEHVYFSISDTGKGFSKNTIPKIFNRYYQIKSLEGKHKPGFGIGLFLVKKFVELHHGTIEVNSQEDKGTTFIITLLKGKNHFDEDNIIEAVEPTRKNTLINGIKAEKEEVNPITSSVIAGDLPNKIIATKKSILVVDDSEEMRHYLYKILGNKYFIIEAEDGNTALDKLSTVIPDVVITDLIMPGLSGDELCSQIKTNLQTKHIPVILLTASNSPEIKLKCIQCGADDFITKPFDKDLLKARIGNLIQVKSNLEKYFYNEITHKTEDLKISQEDKAFIESCVAIIENHLYNDQFTVDTLASEMGKSHSSLYKSIKSITGKSVVALIRLVRLRKAAELFINSASNVNEVAAQVGFNDIKYFRTQFKKVFDITPSAYIKKYRKPFQKNYTLKS